MTVPAGWKLIHDTRDGSLVYEYPDGSEVVVSKQTLHEEMLTIEDSIQVTGDEVV